MSHTLIQHYVHAMRQFWSMRSNLRRRIAQTLRFDWPLIRGIIPPVRLVAMLSVQRCPSVVLTTRPRSRPDWKFLYTRLSISDQRQTEDFSMTETVVKLRLNQQQLE